MTLSTIAARSILGASAASIFLMLPSPGLAQRANENAVTSASDAFGTSVGNERVGIYSPFNARGFSPVEAGNVRVEGLYFDLQAGLNSRLIAGSTMRVGISAQGYPFVAPTGIADFSLRKAGDEAVLSTVLAAGPFGTLRAEADGQLPLSDTLSIAAGASPGLLEHHYGMDERLFEVALVPLWRPSEAVEVMPFFSYTRLTGNEPLPIYFTAGSYLPPEIERGRYYGPSWARAEVSGLNYGTIATWLTGDWTLRGGLFHSVVKGERDYVELALNTSRDGIADRFIAAEGDREFGSTSGELRATRQFAEEERLHQLHLSVRGRDRQRIYGGGALIPLGRRPIDEVAEVPDPGFEVGPQTVDDVRQFTAGLGYEGRWKDVGELSVGIQKTDYRKSVLAPSGQLPISEARPWLFNAGASIHASSRLSFYAGYAKGLEESPVAPPVARNRDEAPPAIITEQKDIGFRLVLPRDMRLVAGLFDVTKPYFGLDETLFFGRLGEVRHRGVELSLAGSPLPGLTAIVGTVLLDAEVTGAAVDQGLIGEKPVGSFVRYTNAAFDYRVPFIPGLSVDLAYESSSDRVADRLNTFVIPERHIFSLGGRYRFQIGKAPATLRAQIGNLTDNYGWGNAGEGFVYNVQQRFSVSLSADW